MDFQTPFEVACKCVSNWFKTFFNFIVDFSKCHKRVSFCTGPADEYTHWKQTVFYLKDCIAAKQGDCIYGNFSMKPNNITSRGPDINIKVSFKSEDSSLEEDNNYTMR